ncbi:hypothetical protein [Ekhidna sp.]|uniref:hypothetical protein n=1 Tax=Ekhidna sp. TaxID=2608089 RepID=UPI003299201E
MPKIIGTRYVLAVKDLKKSAAYYCNQLKFSTVWDSEDWVFLKRDSCFLMLGECKNDISAHETNNHSYFAYIEMKTLTPFTKN